MSEHLIWMIADENQYYKLSYGKREIFFVHVFRHIRFD